MQLFRDILVSRYCYGNFITVDIEKRLFSYADFYLNFPGNSSESPHP